MKHSDCLKQLDRLNSASEVLFEGSDIQFCKWMFHSQNIFTVSSFIDIMYSYDVHRFEDMSDKQLYYFLKCEYIIKLQKIIDVLKDK